MAKRVSQITRGDKSRSRSVQGVLALLKPKLRITQRTPRKGAQVELKGGRAVSGPAVAALLRHRFTPPAPNGKHLDDTLPLF